MNYSPKPYEAKLLYIEQSGEYVTARFGFKSTIPDNGHGEVMIYPTNDGKRAVLEVKHKQAYPLGLRLCNNSDDLGQAVQQIMSDFAKKCKNKQKPVPLGKSLPCVSPIETALTDTIPDSTEQVKIKQNKPNENISEKVKIEQNKPIPETNKNKQKSTTSRPSIQIANNNKQYLVNGDEAAVDLYNGIIVDCFTGEIYPFKGLKALKKAYKRIEKEFVYNVIEGKSVYCTITSDQKPDVDKIRQMGRALQDWIKYNYQIQYALIAYEPNKDGSWHIHLVICFTDGEPAEFEEALRKWADKYNSRPRAEQVDVQSLTDKQDVMRVWCYLNPTLPKKRPRAVFYPKGMKNLTVFGNRSVPKSYAVPNKVLDEIIKRIEARELPCFNTSYMFQDLDGIETRSIDSIYYIIDLRKLLAICENSHNPQKNYYET